jgi:PAS domain S-box-containing protein
MDIMQSKSEICESISNFPSQLPGYAYIFDLEQERIVCSNRPIMETLGYPSTTQNDLDRNFLEKLLHPADLEKISSMLSRLSTDQTEGKVSISFRLKNVSGEWRWLQTKNQICERNSEGQPTHLVGFALDITEQKHTETELKKSENRFRRIFDSDMIGIAFSNPDGRISDANNDFLKTIGYPREDLLAGEINWRKITPPEYSLLDDQAIVQATAAGIFQPFEKEYIRKDGSRVQVLIGGAELLGEKNLYVTYIIDRTAQLETLAALRESEATARTLLNSPLTHAVLFNREGHILDINETMAARFNLTPEQFPRVGGWDLMPKATSQRRWEAFQRAIETGETQRFEDENRGTWFDNIFSPIPDSQGQISRVALLATNITERRRATEALERKTILLELLHQIDQAILNDDAAEQFCQAALEHLLDLLPFISGRIVRFEQNSEMTTSLAIYKPILSELEGQTIPLPQMFPMERLLKGEILHSPDLATLSTPSQIDRIRFESYGVRYYVVVPMKTTHGLIGAIVLARNTPEPFESDDLEIVSETASSLAVGIQHAELNQQIKETEVLLRALTQNVETAREEERRRIAREIHDEFGQALTALKMDTHWVKKRLSRDDQLLINRMDEIEALIDETIGNARRITTELRPGLLDELGLIDTIDWQLRELSNRSGIGWSFELEPDGIEFTPDESTVFYRILQEGLTNIARHSQATEVTVSIRQYPGELQMCIRDDGIGFERLQSFTPNTMGLAGIRERALARGGSLEIDSQPGRGTSLKIKLPSVKGKNNQ